MLPSRPPPCRSSRAAPEGGRETALEDDVGLTRPRCTALPGLMLLAGACVLVLLTSACSATQSPDTSGGPPGKLEPNGPISWSEASARLGEVLTVEGPVQSAGPST